MLVFRKTQTVIAVANPANPAEVITIETEHTEAHSALESAIAPAVEAGAQFRTILSLAADLIEAFNEGRKA